MKDQPAAQDVVVIGGGAAGLSAALTLARARRRVTVVDAGEPRNAPATGVHGYLGLDGITPSDLLARGRDEVTRYGGEVVDGEVTTVSSTSDGFAVTLQDCRVLHARRLVIATGLVDELPDVPGLRERWGRDVVHCPYCHGWEVRDRRIGVLATSPMSVHQAILFRQWSDDVLLLANGQLIENDERLKLDALGIPVVDGAVAGLEVLGDELTGVRLDGDRGVEVTAVAAASRLVVRTELFAGIGIEASEHPAGSFIAADEMGRTSVPGVWVAGNSTDLFAQVSGSAAAGARAAMHLNGDLILEDADRAVAQLVSVKG
jgi:thioredoxin reductase